MSLFEKLLLIKKIQTKRYRQKGAFNTMIGITALFCIFLAVWSLGYSLWPQKIQDKHTFFMIWAILIHFGAELKSFLLFLPGYLGAKCYKKYTVEKDTVWPWQKSDWNKRLKKILLILFLNQFVVYPVLMYMNVLRGWKIRFDGFPSLEELIVQIFGIYYIEDIFVCSFHYVSHLNKYAYKFHKVHHQYQKTFSIINEYVHPIDYIFGLLLPSSIVLTLFGTNIHCFTFFFWVFYKITMSSQVHSGFDFPWSPFRVLPFVFGAQYHDFHHSKNAGNYGALFVWDILFGTSTEFFQRYLNNQSKQKEFTNISSSKSE